MLGLCSVGARPPSATWRSEARDALGLNNSILTQFWHFLSNAVQGDFGFSLRQGSKVSTLVAERFPATLELALAAAFLALCFGIPMGVYAALRRTGGVVAFKRRRAWRWRRWALEHLPRRRRPDDLTPVPVSDVPSEARPQALTGAVTQDMGPEVRYRCMAASEKAVLELD